MDVIQIQQGVPYSADIVIYDDTVDPAVVMDITMLIVFISVKKLTDNRQDDTEAIISSKITSHVDPVNGHTQWDLIPAETYQKLGRYKADLRLYTSTYVYVNSATFYIDIVPVVTKRTS